MPVVQTACNAPIPSNEVIESRSLFVVVKDEPKVGLGKESVTEQNDVPVRKPFVDDSFAVKLLSTSPDPAWFCIFGGALDEFHVDHWVIRRPIIDRLYRDPVRSQLWESSLESKAV